MEAFMDMLIHFILISCVLFMTYYAFKVAIMDLIEQEKESKVIIKQCEKEIREAKDSIYKIKEERKNMQIDWIISNTEL